MQEIRDHMYALDIIIYDEDSYNDKHVFILDNVGLHTVDIKALQRFGDININLWSQGSRTRIAVIYYLD